jgi:hypothetical protein
MRDRSKSRGRARGRECFFTERAANGASRSTGPPSARALATFALCATWLTACTSWTSVPPSQLHRLVSARTENIELVGDEGTAVTISRSDVREVKPEARDGWVLMTATEGAGVAVAVPEAAVAEAKRRGWTKVPSFAQPLELHLQRDTLWISGQEGEATVPLGVLERVKVKEFSNGKTALAILGPLVGVAVVALVLTSCGGCFATSPPN